MIDYTQILPNLYVGTYPGTLDDVRELKDRCGVTAVLSVQSDEDLRDRDIHWPAMEDSYKKVGVEVRRVPLRDFDREDQRQNLPEAVSALAALLASGHIVYLHCNAGTGRSPLVAMAYLHWYRKMGRRQAIKYVRDRRFCVPYEDLLEADSKSGKP